MKLLISVVHRDELYALIDALVRKGYGATVINTTGGFLREGNATLLIGAEDECVADVLKIIRANCHARTKNVIPSVPVAGLQEAGAIQRIRIRVGGAVVFIADVEQFVKC
jgi:uncharacterized protein YaaQ